MIYDKNFFTGLALVAVGLALGLSFLGSVIGDRSIGITFSSPESDAAGWRIGVRVQYESFKYTLCIYNCPKKQLKK